MQVVFPMPYYKVSTLDKRRRKRENDFIKSMYELENFSERLGYLNDTETFIGS